MTSYVLNYYLVKKKKKKVDIFSFKILNIFLYIYTELFFLRDQ